MKLTGKRLMGLREDARRNIRQGPSPRQDSHRLERPGQRPSILGRQIDRRNRNTYWAADDDVRTGELTVELGDATQLNRVRLQEYIQLGQRIESFAIDARVDGTWEKIATGTTIGPRRILRTPTVAANAIRLRITGTRACPTISTLELYLAPKKK